jgi:hypothetical protein
MWSELSKRLKRRNLTLETVLQSQAVQIGHFLSHPWTEERRQVNGHLGGVSPEAFESASQ